MPIPNPAPGRLRAAVLGLLTLLTLLATGAVVAPMASAAPCLTCEQTPPPPPGPPGPPPTYHRLTINKIIDWNNQDPPNELYDEIYIKVNGQKVWGPVDVTYLNGEKSVNVSKTLIGNVGNLIADVELWDQDPVDDDRIGTLHVYGNGSPTPISGSYELKGADARYTIDITLQKV